MGMGGSGEEWIGISLDWVWGVVCSSRKVYITVVVVVEEEEEEEEEKKLNLREGFMGKENSDNGEAEKRLETLIDKKEWILLDSDFEPLD